MPRGNFETPRRPVLRRTARFLSQPQRSQLRQAHPQRPAPRPGDRLEDQRPLTRWWVGAPLHTNKVATPVSKRPVPALGYDPFEPYFDTGVAPKKCGGGPPPTTPAPRFAPLRGPCARGSALGARVASHHISTSQHLKSQKRLCPAGVPRRTTLKPHSTTLQGTKWHVGGFKG